MFTVWLVLAYICGAMAWSVWLSRLAGRGDPRREADGNPGAANAFKVGGWPIGVATLILDFLKAFLPVFIAQRGYGFSDGQLLLIALMPSLGHAFSIFLNFRGGRAIVTWFGVWTALTLYEVPLVMGTAAIVGSLLTKNGERRTLTISAVLIPYLVLREKPLWMIGLAVAQLLIVVAKIGVFYGSMRRKVA